MHPFSSVMLILAPLAAFGYCCNGQNFTDDDSSMRELSTCTGFPDPVTIKLKGASGTTLSCPNGFVAFQACTPSLAEVFGSTIFQFGCDGIVNQQTLSCVAYGNGDVAVVQGPETDWLGTGATGWAFCPLDKPVMTSRCSSALTTDCKLPSAFNHGIRCRKLSPQFYLKDDSEVYACGSLQAGSSVVACPEGYFPVGGCGSGYLQGCESFGCSGLENVITGLKCLKVGFLNSMEWDYSKEPYYEIEILSDINPVVGTMADVEVNFDSHASASVSSSLNFNLEFGGKVGLEANLMSAFGFPSFFGLFDNDEFVDLDVETSFSGGADFNAAAAAQASASLDTQYFSYRVSSLDAWAENFVRFVHYKRKRVKNVLGPVQCCNCDRSDTTVNVRFETEQTGYLALHIKNYRDLNLEQISGKDFVELYLNGTIVGYGENGPLRGFTDSQTRFETFRIFLRSLRRGRR